MIKFLGSLFFTIILLAITLLFVIIGTFLESSTRSHLFAAKLTFQNPFFQLLFWLYFINILFAAITRFPFKTKHIPFLLTHLGLLLLFLGIFLKNHYGVQGAMLLSEGTGSSTILLANTYSLEIESPRKRTIVQLKPGVRSIQTGHDRLECSLLEWVPHAEESYEGFIKGKWAHLVGLPPIPIDGMLETAEYKIHALQTNEITDLSFPGYAALYLIQDSNLQEHLIAFNQTGEKFATTLKGEAYYIYNKGYGGYGIFVELPESFPKLELIAPLTRSSKPGSIPKKREEQTPRIRLALSEDSQSEIVTLTYDKYREKFKWPVLGGKYLMCFQSHLKPLPYRVRLLSAKQQNYPGTNKPYSYEAKVAIDEQETTLSMNHVYEKKGYRFYLANFSQSPSGANRVQIVVNYDPAKYFLTYPGAITLAVGVLLLYVRKRYV